MELLLPPAFLALVAAVLARWWRWHPLTIAAWIGAGGGAFGLLVACTFATDGRTIVGAGLFAFAVSAGVAALGAFVGWLRRTHIERTAP